MIDLIEIARGWAEDPALLQAQNSVAGFFYMLAAVFGALAFFAPMAFIEESKLTPKIVAVAFIIFVLGCVVFAVAFGWTLSYANALDSAPDFPAPDFAPKGGAE